MIQAESESQAEVLIETNRSCCAAAVVFDSD